MARFATWNLEYFSNAAPWLLPNSRAAADYPNYFEIVSLEVCLKDLGLDVGYGAISNLFEDSSKAPPNNPPTARSNAFVPASRKKVNDDISQRYEANIGALKQLLEDISIDNSNGGTDVSGIPTSISGYDEPYKDPFRNGGKKPSSNKPSTNGEQPSGSSTVAESTSNKGSAQLPVGAKPVSSVDWTRIGNDSLPPGHVVEQSCAFRSVGGGPFIFSPTEPGSFICVHPKGTANEVPKGGGMPDLKNCSRAPD